jgi:hypothetical protein
MQATGRLGEPDGSNREQVGSSAETNGLFPAKDGRESVECLHPDRDIVLLGDAVVDPVSVLFPSVALWLHYGYIIRVVFLYCIGYHVIGWNVEQPGSQLQRIP